MSKYFHIQETHPRSPFPQICCHCLPLYETWWTTGHSPFSWIARFVGLSTFVMEPGVRWPSFLLSMVRKIDISHLLGAAIVRCRSQNLSCYDWLYYTTLLFVWFTTFRQYQISPVERAVFLLLLLLTTGSWIASVYHGPAAKCSPRKQPFLKT